MTDRAARDQRIAFWLVLAGLAVVVVVSLVLGMNLDDWADLFDF